MFKFFFFTGSNGKFFGQYRSRLFAACCKFQDQSTGSPISWQWNFGNGNTSTLQNPITTYITPGTYTVTLTVSNANGSNTLTRSNYITVHEAPAVNFSSNVTSGCFPLRVQFTDLTNPGSGNTITSWFWDFGNGNTSTSANPFVIYNQTGNYTATLRVTNDKGCTKTLTRTNYIQVTDGVRASFTNTQPTVCRPPATIQFTNTSSGSGTLSFNWNFGDRNTSTLPNPSHTYLNSGTYVVTLITSSSAGCVDTVLSNPITIGGIQTSFNSPVQACVNERVTFTNTSSPASVSSQWSFGDGSSASGLHAHHIYSAPGNYTIRLINTYANCTDSAFSTITIHPNPVASFQAAPTSRCEPPLTVNFQNNSTGAVSWLWDFGDGNISTLPNPTHTYTAYGSFTVKLVVTSLNGCKDSVIFNNLIQIRRTSISIPGIPVNGCIPYTINLSPSINSLDPIASYFWDFGDGNTSTSPSPTHTY
ncbi:MAG: PKD domain-containing protein, partial [Chitinophagaceae bacterium]|nr:PKD domain-containing protein [Chitinophagaceae bacterium]